MSYKTQIFLSSGVIMMTLVAIGMIYFGIQQATEISLAGKEQSEENEQVIKDVDAKINEFIEVWFERVNKSNVIQNNTQDQLLNISHTL